YYNRLKAYLQARKRLQHKHI
ncbi:MAG TPA: CidA/LrgA family protein, partial [Acinetobacter nosocomialis]|nr:CidA/LrgA family protein [Acinetobacter nosocomialis]